MKNTLLVLRAVGLAFFLVWIATAFAAFDVNPANWGLGGRMFFVSVGTVLSLILVMAMDYP